MSHVHNVRATLSPYGFLSKVITPVVLLFGLLVLVVYNFGTVIKSINTQDDAYHGLVSFNQGSLRDSFKEFTGLDRPSLTFNGHSLLSYVEWNSTISIDGDVQELWNNYHGYSVDEANHQIYNTISGAGWQLIEIATLLNEHTITVTFNFVTRPQSTVPPAHYVFEIMHTQNFWYNQVLQNRSFTAQVAEGDPANLQNTSPAYQTKSLGKITLTMAEDAAHNSSLRLSDMHTATDAVNKVSWARAVISEYKLDNPPSFQMITLGTETITFQPAPTNPNLPAA